MYYSSIVKTYSNDGQYQTSRSICNKVIASHMRGSFLTSTSGQVSLLFYLTAECILSHAMMSSLHAMHGVQRFAKLP